MLTNEALSVGAKLAYAMLLKYAWTDDACFPGQAKLAKDMGSAERSIRTYLKELETAGFLEIIQRGLGNTEHLSPLSDCRRQPQASPGLTGKICRSRAATAAGQERQIWPVSLYKNTHLIIHIFKNTQ